MNSMAISCLQRAVCVPAHQRGLRVAPKVPVCVSIPASGVKKRLGVAVQDRYAGTMPSTLALPFGEQQLAGLQPQPAMCCSATACADVQCAHTVLADSCLSAGLSVTTDVLFFRTLQYQHGCCCQLIWQRQMWHSLCRALQQLHVSLRADVQTQHMGPYRVCEYAACPASAAAAAPPPLS